MVTGVLGAAAQNEVRRLLSFHIVSQIGYMLMGLGLFTPLALAGVDLLHRAPHRGEDQPVPGQRYRVRRLAGNFELKGLGGLPCRVRGSLVLFLVPASPLAGIPPLSGFWAKLSLVQAGLGPQQYAIVAVALAVSLLTLFSMTKIWDGGLLEAGPDAERQGRRRRGRTRAAHGCCWRLSVVLAAITVLIGSGRRAAVFDLSFEAAEQLYDPC